MSRADFLYDGFIKQFKFEPTSCQDNLFRSISSFLTCDDADVLVVNGYAGTGKTSALASVIKALRLLHIHTVLMAPTGRAAKVLSSMAGVPASTVHKHIYRQKSVGADGFGQFSLSPNKSKDTLFVVDEASLIGVDMGERQSSAAFGSGNLLEDLVTFVRNGNDCRLILLGDSAQLPPVGLVGSPALSREFMDGFGGVRYAELSEVVRQAQESGILVNATAVRKLIVSSSEDEVTDGLRLSAAGFDDVSRVSGAELIETLSDAYSRYGEDETVVLCRSNRRAIRYNLGIRSSVQFKEEKLVHGDRLMIVRNCYQFVDEASGMDYIANGDIAKLVRIGGYEERYGLHFADATLDFPDYDNVRLKVKVCLDTLESESAALTYEQQNALFNGVSQDYAHITSRKKRYEAVREDKFYNALQLKYANAVTCHKSQGGQWKCVFIDCPFWQDEQTVDDLKWLYTAVSRAVEKVYFVNFPDRFFE